MRGKKEVLPVLLKESDKKRHVLTGTVRDKKVTVTVSFVEDGIINIRSSGTNDMDYYLWKRGRLPDEKGPSEKSLAIEVMKKSLEDPSNKPDSGDGK